MKKQIEKRLHELKSEFESGQKMLSELEEKRQNLNQTLLRISGAIQVLEEELGKTDNNWAASESQHNFTPAELHEIKKEAVAT